MWENKEDSESIDNGHSSLNYVEKTDSNDPCSLLENYESIFFHDSSFIDPFKKSIKEATTQVPNLSYSDFTVTEPTELKGMTTEQSSNTDQTKKKRGRGRGSRGSYKPRGRSRFIGSSYSNSYGMVNPVQKVCINPEILRRLGYPNPGPTEYYDATIPPSFALDERNYTLWNPMNIRLCMPMDNQNVYGYQGQPLNFSQINQNFLNQQRSFTEVSNPIENPQPTLPDLPEKMSLDSSNVDVELSYMYVNQDSNDFSLSKCQDDTFELKNEPIPVENLINFPCSEKKDKLE